MDAVYLEIREIARRIVARSPRPDFYIDRLREVRSSGRFYQSDPCIVRLGSTMAGRLDNDFGHGLGHAEKVAIDAGTLAIIESRLAGHGETQVQRNLLLAQCAGLLHDICRKEPDHAEKGAQMARDILSPYPLVPEEIALVCAAIRNHEAFGQPDRLPTERARLLSDCLYDADKFRWGPDNFTHTVWDMVGFANLSLYDFVSHYPQGMDRLEKIRGTFRSRTGRRYGPQFIDLGMAIGEELYRIIMADFIASP